MADVPTNGTEQRLRYLESRMTSVETDLKVLPRLEERYNNLHSDLGELRSDVKGVRSAMLTGGVSLLVGALVFSITAFQIWGS